MKKGVERTDETLEKRMNPYGIISSRSLEDVYGPNRANDITIIPLRRYIFVAIPKLHRSVRFQERYKDFTITE